MRRRRVAVLFGGRSAEHEISCISARSVIDALDPARVEVVPIGITRGREVAVLPDVPRLPAESGVMPHVSDADGAGIELSGEAGAREMVRADGTRERARRRVPGPARPDGGGRRDPGLAGARRGSRTWAPASLGSAVGMDKAVQKALFAAAGLPVAPHEVVREPDWREDPEGVAARVGALGLPGLHQAGHARLLRGDHRRIADDDGLADGLEEAFRYARKAVVERGDRARARGGVRGPRQRRSGGVGGRGDRPQGPRVLRLRGEVPRRGRRGAADPGVDRRRGRRADPADGGRWRSAPRRARGWRASTSSCGARTSSG